MIAWIVVAIVWQRAIFSGTNIGLFIVLYVVTGLSLASWTQLVAVPFAAAPTLAAITCMSTSPMSKDVKLMDSYLFGNHPRYWSVALAKLGRDPGCLDTPLPSDVLHLLHQGTCFI